MKDGPCNLCKQFLAIQRLLNVGVSIGGGLLESILGVQNNTRDKPRLCDRRHSPLYDGCHPSTIERRLTERLTSSVADRYYRTSAVETALPALR